MEPNGRNGAPVVQIGAGLVDLGGYWMVQSGEYLRFGPNSTELRR